MNTGDELKCRPDIYKFLIRLEISFEWLSFTSTFFSWVECAPIARETGVQSPV